MLSCNKAVCLLAQSPEKSLPGASDHLVIDEPYCASGLMQYHCYSMWLAALQSVAMCYECANCVTSMLKYKRAAEYLFINMLFAEITP